MSAFAVASVVRVPIGIALWGNVLPVTASELVLEVAGRCVTPWPSGPERGRDLPTPGTSFPISIRPSLVFCLVHVLGLPTEPIASIKVGMAGSRRRT